jgi:DNA-binding NarL/FixJ family response regulator
MKVVIADDSAEIRKRIIEMLSDIEKIDMIGQAENVPEAIEKISEFNPDLVILDIRMPGGNGIDVLKKIEKRNRLPVVIMLTNYPSSQYRKKCIGSGADFFLDKSNEFEKVVEIVNNCMSVGRILSGRRENTKKEMH